MIPYIGTCMFLVGIFIFLTVVFVGGLENGLPLPLQLTLAIVTIITIITALVVSYYAFQKVVRGDVETTLRFPAWDHAMATWKNFYYCKRDDVIFDPKTNKVVSEEQVAALRNLNVPEGQAQSALASH